MTVVTVMKEVRVVNIMTLGDSSDINYRSNSGDIRDSTESPDRTNGSQSNEKVTAVMLITVVTVIKVMAKQVTVFTVESLIVVGNFAK